MPYADHHYFHSDLPSKVSVHRKFVMTKCNLTLLCLRRIRRPSIDCHHHDRRRPHAGSLSTRLARPRRVALARLRLHLRRHLRRPAPRILHPPERAARRDALAGVPATPRAAHRRARAEQGRRRAEAERGRRGGEREGAHEEEGEGPEVAATP